MFVCPLVVLVLYLNSSNGSVNDLLIAELQLFFSDLGRVLQLCSWCSFISFWLFLFEMFFLLFLLCFLFVDVSGFATHLLTRSCLHVFYLWFTFLRIKRNWSIVETTWLVKILSLNWPIVDFFNCLGFFCRSFIGLGTFETKEIPLFFWCLIFKDWLSICSATYGEWFWLFIRVFLS